jgi:hypothetical protein
MLTMAIHPMIKFDLAKQQYCFCQEEQWMQLIGSQLATHSALDLGLVHHLPHALLLAKDTYCLPEKIDGIPNALRRIQNGRDQNALL